MRKTILTIFSLSAILSLLLSGCGGAQATPTQEPGSSTAFNPVVSATGKIVPEKWASIAMPVEGLLVEVPAAEGDAVNAGQLLVRLDGQEAVQARLAAARQKLASAQKALQKLHDDAPLQAAQAQQDITAAQQDIIKAERDLVRFDLQAYKDELDRAHKDMVDAKDNLKTAQEDFDPYQSWAEDNATRKSYKDRLDEAQRKYDETLRKEDDLRVQKNHAQSVLVNAQARLSVAQAHVEKYKNGPDALELAEAQALVDSAQASITAEQAALKRLEVHAPFAGLVSRLEARQGEWAAAGVSLLLLADPASLRVETTDLNEIDAARVSLDDPVKVTFDALPGVTLKGRVVRIAPKSAEGSGVNYTAAIALDQLDPALRWGMTAFIDIEVEE